MAGPSTDPSNDPQPKASAARPQRPSTLAMLSVACGVGGLGLVGLGSLAGRVGLLGPVAAYGGLVVALGAAIVGTTLSAVALLTSRTRAEGPRADGTSGGSAGAGPAAAQRRTSRSRAWVGVAVNLGLLIALLGIFARGVGRPLVVGADGAPAPDAAAAAEEATLLDAAALRELRAAHPDLVPVAIPEPVDVAFARARRTAEALGWEIAARDDAAHRLDARAGSGGPDLEIRVHPAPDGSVVAIRPTGDGRLEESLARIRAFSERLTRR